MLHGQLLDKLLIAVVAVALGALAAPVVEARADAAQVTVIAPGGSRQTLSLAALAGAEDVVGRAYLLRSGEGEAGVTVTGFSLAALIDAAGADPYAFSYLEILRPAGGAVQLSRDQALDPGAFPEGPPVIYATPTGTAFLRPSSGSEDLNGSDSFEAPRGVTVALRKGSPLRVRVSASTLRTRPGKPVAFEAEVERAGAGERLSYSWYFDDGASASGPSAAHRFARRGSYDVVVGVTTPGDSTGASAVVTVQVGPPLEGPDRKGGGTRHDRDAPDHGAAGGSDGSQPGIQAPAAAAGADSAPAATQHSRQEREPPRSAAGAPGGTPVSGRLLSAPASAAPEPGSQPAARAGKPGDEEVGGLSLPGTAVGLLVTAGLIGFGALTETRSLLR